MEPRTFPAGTYILRMDQPYSRIADALLDYQYWSPRDPQQSVYDDTGWTFGEAANVQVVRVTDTKVLDAAMQPISGEVRAAGGVSGTGSIYLVNANADNNLITLRYRLRKASFDAVEEPFEAAGKKFNRGAFIVRNASTDEMNKVASELGVQASSGMFVPLQFRGVSLGVIEAFDRAGGPEFRDDDERLLSAAADSAATAVATAQSVEQDRLRRTLRAAEDERRRWARELHDETLQGLGGLRVLLSSARRSSDVSDQHGCG